MQGVKCLGPDGYQFEFYKKFQDKLAPFFKDTFNELFSSNRLPRTINQVSILTHFNSASLLCSLL